MTGVSGFESCFSLFINCHFVICYCDPGNKVGKKSAAESNIDKNIEHKARAFSSPL